MVGADLMPEAARSAVDHDGDLISGETERRGDALVEDFGDVLELGEVVARPERAIMRSSA